MVTTRWRCPLTDLAEALGADDGRVSDIFLLRWFADSIADLHPAPVHRSCRTGVASNTAAGARRHSGVLTPVPVSMTAG